MTYGRQRGVIIDRRLDVVEHDPRHGRSSSGKLRSADRSTTVFSTSFLAFAALVASERSCCVLLTRVSTRNRKALTLPAERRSLRDDVGSGGADLRSFAARAPASSMWTASLPGGSLYQVPRPQNRAKRRIKTSRGAFSAVLSICSTASAAVPSRSKETLSTTSRGASAAMAALTRFAPPSRRTLSFASPFPEERSVRKLTTMCGRTFCATPSKSS